MANNLSGALRERRNTLGLTLCQVSTISGVSVAHIGRIENGQRFPSGCILRKLAEPLGFSEVELLKLAGFLSRDSSDDRLSKLKNEIKNEIACAFGALSAKVDSL